MQYYAAAMLVMFLLYNITVGAKSVVTEQRTETLARLFSTPTSSFSILFGKFLGTLLFACIQFGIFIVATHFMFHVEWGADVSQIVVLGISYAICVSGLSTIYHISHAIFLKRCLFSLNSTLFGQDACFFKVSFLSCTLDNIFRSNCSILLISPKKDTRMAKTTY